MAKMRIKKGDLVQVISGRSQKNGGDRGLRAVRKDIARIYTEMHERALGIGRAKAAE